MKISFLLPITVTLVGLYLLVRLRFFFLLHPVRTAREFFSSLSDRSSRRSFFLALAGTLGVGNIFGVAAGLMIGGAGSLFWLFISSFFAMIIKYAETLLAFDERVSEGGMASALRSVFGKIGKALAPIYAGLMLLLAFFMGSAMQSAALCDVARESLGFNPLISAFILIILLTPAFIGGAKKIESITEFVIPLTTIIYIIMCFLVIMLNFSRFGEAIKMILREAFDFRPALGGGLSFLAIREGFARGILSNEAGVGSSAMAHIRSKGRSPHMAGLFAMCEVVFDSSLLCILTGLAILTALPDISAFSSPMALVSYAFTSTLGAPSGYILTFLILAFAYATIICWYYYGAECVRLYFSKIGGLYPLLFLLSMLLPSVARSSFLLYVIDLILLLMSLLTLSAILKRSPRIEALCLMENKNPE